MQTVIDTPASSSETRRSAAVQLHGVLVRVLGTGVLLIGESGIGKSECALDLITRGHEHVADDVVDVTVADDETLIGRAPELIYELLEIRGLGVINVREVFGNKSTRRECNINICVELAKWSDSERIENVVEEFSVAGRVLPKFILPVSPGRNLATLVETAVRLYATRGHGANAAQLLIKKQKALLDPLGSV